MSKRGVAAESPRMFENDFLDFFSRCHPATVVVLYVPGVLALLFESSRHATLSTLTTSCFFAFGFGFWTLAEYWLHRMVFHWQGHSSWGKRLHFLIHGVHHRWPLDRYRLIMPPGASIPLYFGFLGLFLLAFGRFGWSLYAGFVAGYLFYDLTHFWLHHGVPRSRYGRRLRRNHMLHHFKDSSSRFGVSNLIWDGVFRTNGTAISPARADAAAPSPDSGRSRVSH
jgi:sterol desaturase/sphingolipid hydroxylase (fatty acid hydroxylase superfamily)